MSTIRFKDLGKPIQQLLKSLKEGYTDEDMALMEYVSVKDMAQIYNDLNAQKEAEQIWKALKKQLKKRKKEMENAEGNVGKYTKEEEEIEAQLEADRQAEEEAERKREEKKRKREEKKRRQKEAEEAAEREAQELADAEERERRREERRRRQQELEEQAEREAEEERLREEEERKARKAERKRLKAERERVQREREELEEAMRLKKQKQKETQAEQWNEYVRDHPLEFGGEEAGEVIEQVEVHREQKGPPKEFLCIKGVKIPSFVDREEDKATYFKVVVHRTNGSKHEVERRYSQFFDMKQKLGALAEIEQAPFPGKTWGKVKGAGLEKRRGELELWMNYLIRKMSTTRSYAGVSLDSKQQLRGDAARAEAERQRMQQAAISRSTLYEFCEIEE